MKEDRYANCFAGHAIGSEEAAESEIRKELCSNQAVEKGT